MEEDGPARSARRLSVVSNTPAAPTEGATALSVDTEPVPLTEAELCERASAALRDLAVSGEECPTRALLLRLSVRFAHPVDLRESA